MSTGEAQGKGKVPRRIVLLHEAGETSAVETVLREYSPAEAGGSRLHADLQELATAHAGRTVAAEWLGPLGWVRFLWCRR